MAVSVSPIKIISDLGYDPVDIESDEDYLSALMEATNTLSIEALSRPGRSDSRIQIIQDEVRRIRADRKAADPNFKERKTTINIGSFLGRDKEPQKLLGPSKDQKKKAASGGLVDTINAIAEAVGRIEDTLKDQTKLDIENKKLQNQTLENEDREKKEGRLEKVTGFLKKAGDKIIAPVQSIFGKIFGFIKNLILGKIFLNILKWFGNPANQGKIDSVIKFLGNNWGKLLSLYLVFGTGLGRFIRFIAKTLITGTIKLVALAAQLAAARKIKGARGVLRQVRGAKGGKLGAALNIIGTAGAVVGMGRMFQGGGEEEEPQKFNKGGKVRGQGDKDTVPAMLTPGEFVMSKGAVQQYGIDTMESMNAAAGGTNVPVLMPNKKRKGYNEGGVVNRIQPEDLIHVNNERKLQGLPPLDKLTYAAGVTPSVRKGPGPKTSEYTDTHTDLETMVRTITRTVNGETTRESFKLSNEEAEAVLKEKGYPSMKLADGSVVIDSASFGYDKMVSGLASWRVQMAEGTPIQQKALAEFNALPDVIAMDQGIADGSLREEVISTARMHKSGTKENLMQKNMNRIAEMDGDETVPLMNFNGGGLVQGFSGGGRVFSQEEANAMAEAFDNRPMAQLQKLRNERDAMERGPDGKLSRKDRKRWNEIGSEISTIQRQIIASRGGTSTPTSTPTQTPTQTPVNQKKKSGGGFGLKRMIGGAADQLTGNLFDFDKRSGGGLIRKTAGALARPMGGLADMMTGNLFDFDNRSGGGLIRKTANAVGGLFGGENKPVNSDKVMAKEPKIKELQIPADGLKSVNIKIASKQDIKPPVGQPSLSAPKITVLPENKSINSPLNNNAPDGGKSIPKFDVGYGSARKMKQLGISR